MPFEDQLPAVLDGILQQIREHLDRDFLALAQELGHLAAAERQRIAASAGQPPPDVRRDTGPQLAELREAVRREVEDVRRGAQQQVAEVQRLMQLRLAAADEQARIADTTRVQQLAQGIASIDAGHSLGDVLERLAEAAAGHASRTIVFLVRGGAALTEWRRVGFTSAAAGAEIPIGTAGFVGTAVSTGRPAHSDGAALPPFAGAVANRDAAAFPVTVGGTVVAVLYGDADRTGGSAWTTALDVLARYATRVLETMTMQQATGLWPPRGAARA